MYIEENVPLAPLTTFNIGGPARFFVRVQSLDDLREAIDFAKEKKLKVLALGGGSNTLADDVGFPGLVLKMDMLGVELIAGDGDSSILVAGAGESWDAVVARAIARGLWGIENLSGIPGTVGAAPVQNIGAYGAEAKDALVWVEAFHIQTGRITRFEKSECKFSYRMSLFKKNPGIYFITRVAFLLHRKGTPNISYRDLSEFFTGNAAPTLQEIRDAILSIRARKFPDLSKEGTAGSFFLNPIVSAEKAMQLRERFPDLPSYPAETGAKVSLAWLLDHALHVRGMRIGGARLFEKQPLIIVADRGTSSCDVYALADSVIEKMRDVLNIKVETEVQKVF